LQIFSQNLSLCQLFKPVVAISTFLKVAEIEGGY
jgi:hypothetical protein